MAIFPQIKMTDHLHDICNDEKSDGQVDDQWMEASEELKKWMYYNRTYFSHFFPA
tara:strand:+ start:173 stop:337 length:165 start_codon:yes stop_codon:yes gene_type:complete